MLSRRLYGRYLTAKSKHLEARVREIEEGKFDVEYENLRKMPVEELHRIYEERWIEPK